MPGLLEGQLAKAVFAGFKGKLLKGQLRRLVPVESGGLDSFGDDAAPPTPVLYSCEGFTEDYSDYARANAGIPEEDVKVNLFAASLPAGVRPLKDDQVKLTRAGVDSWYQLRRDATDPAEALWVCQAFKLQEAPA